ncbi:MAG: hypothetical protein ACO3JL_01935 [Myxococcota bacterium]
MNVALGTAMFVWGVLVATHPAVERCRSLEADFDYTGVVSSCALAMADTSLSAAERTEVARLLAFAHVALGDEDTAQDWFMRALVLEPSYRPDEDVSPRFRDAFLLALQRIEREGALQLTAISPQEPADADDDEPLRLAFTLSDPLRRVARAELVLGAAVTEAASTRVPLRTEETGEPGGSRLVADVVAEHFTVEADGTRALLYRVALLAPSGTELPLSPPFEAVRVTRAPPTSSMWLWRSLAIAGGVVVMAAAAGGVALYCTLGSCGETPAGAPAAVVRVTVDGALGAQP